MYITTTICDGVLHCLLFLMFFWCPYMAINVTVQYNGGFLPDIILLTQCYLHRRTCLNAIKRFCIIRKERQIGTNAKQHVFYEHQAKTWTKQNISSPGAQHTAKPKIRLL